MSRLLLRSVQTTYRKNCNVNREKRQRGDSNPCGQSPMDFESISLAARTHCQWVEANRWQSIINLQIIDYYILSLCISSCGLMDKAPPP